jgi:hypothetical protein
MSDVFQVLGNDHAEVQRMLDALESSPGNSSGATEAVAAARKRAARTSSSRKLASGRDCESYSALPNPWS